METRPLSDILILLALQCDVKGYEYEEEIGNSFYNFFDLHFDFLRVPAAQQLPAIWYSESTHRCCHFVTCD